jgi:MFS family permease
MFDLNGEQNAPTLFSSMLLISAGALCFFTSRLASRWRWQWCFMALVFIVLGIDETFELHEPLFFILRGNRSESTAELADKLDGIRWSDLYVWIIIAIMLLLIWYWSLIQHVGRKVLVIAVWSAAIYLFGVIGIDNVLVAENDVPTIIYLPLSILEEVCEFVGVSLFIYAVLVYLSEHYNIVIRLDNLKRSE